MEIIWTLTAKNTFKSNIKYLQDEWTEQEVSNFTFEVYRKLELLALNPNMGRYDEELKCRKLVLIKQITLLYIIENNTIFLLSFWNNYKKPLKKLL